MRLIDADELIKRMRKWMPKDPCGREQTVEEVVATDIAASVFMEIEEIPTAFGKEKVIEELNGEIELCVTHPLYPGRYIKKVGPLRLSRKAGLNGHN